MTLLPRDMADHAIVAPAPSRPAALPVHLQFGRAPKAVEAPREDRPPLLPGTALRGDDHGVGGAG